MNALARRIVTLFLCCWLPLPAIAAVTLECHSLRALHEVETLPQKQLSSADQSGAKAHHSGCSGQPVEVDETAGTDTEQHDTCSHCQVSCHSAQLLFPASGLNPAQPESPGLPGYIPAHPRWVFLSNPQRPPQAAQATTSIVFLL